MFDNKEEFISAARDNFETQLDAMISLTHAGFDGFAKIIDLNVGAMQAAFAESAVAMRQLQSPVAPQEWLSLSISRTQPAAGKALDYCRHVAAILSETQAEFVRASQEQMVENNHKLLEMVNTIAKNAPAGKAMNAVKESTAKAAAKAARSSRADLAEAA
jgi:phasin family protein